MNRCVLRKEEGGVGEHGFRPFEHAWEPGRADFAAHAVQALVRARGTLLFPHSRFSFVSFFHFFASLGDYDLSMVQFLATIMDRVWSPRLALARSENLWFFACVRDMGVISEIN